MTTAKSSGRICLLGDNADLIEKPAIAAAISAYLTVTLQPRDDDRIVLDGPDIGAREEFSLGEQLSLDSPLRYMKAVVARMRDRVTHGFEARVTSQIPIASGLSSSAALVIATIRALSAEYGIPMDAAETAIRAMYQQHIVVPEFLVESMEKLGEIVCRCGHTLQKATELLFDEYHRAADYYGKVDPLESQADVLENELVDSIFSSNLEMGQKLLLRDLVLLVGQIADRAEEAADHMHILLVKRKL